MTEQRRYQEDEIKQIFGAAAEAREPGKGPPTSAGGLTLGDLQEIGREVGIAPDRIAEAARALDRPADAGATSAFLGIPLTVGRTVDLPRSLTEDEWEILVGEVRQTFGATGKQRHEGKLRAWTNGNLHVITEPTVAGHRLRMGTRKSSALPSVAMGAFWIVGGGFLMSDAVIRAGTWSWLVPLGFVGFGIATLLSTALRLPRWARTRELQMEQIGQRALSFAADEPR